MASHFVTIFVLAFLLHQAILQTIPICPAGYRCPEGLEISKCGKGEYSPPKQTQCFKCPSGHQQCLVCPVGHACPYGSINPTPCDPPKYFSHTKGAGKCNECPKGAKCTSAHSEPEQCPPGQHNKNGSCKLCPAGFACLPTVQQCPQGSYSLEGQTVCFECPRGHSCLKSDVAPVKCNPGSTSEKGQLECTLCPAGHHCPTPQMQPLPCPPRVSFSKPGATYCSKCPSNHSCPDPSLEPVPCPEGTEPTPEGAGFCGNLMHAQQNTIYSGESEVRELQQCAQPNQYYNPQTNSCVVCNPGQECINGFYYIRSCFPGTYNDGSGLKCLVCPTGSYCSKTTVTPCAPGTFSLYGSTECHICPAGYKCQNTFGSSIKYCGLEWGRYAEPGSTECSLCPVGHFCNDQFPQPCLEGQFSIIGDANCHWVPAGMSSNPDGTVSECPPGYYSLYKQKSCTQCPENHMCPSRGASPVVCPFNTATAPGSTQCTVCPRKHYSIHGGPCVPVQQGWYSTYNQPFFVPRMAIYGTYSDGEKQSYCDPGYVCYSEINTPTPVTLCPAGYYCDLRGDPAFVDPIVCPKGFYKPTESTAKSRGDCLVCPAGRYCMEASIVAIICPNGFYCPAGSAYYNDLPCPQGTFTQAPGASSLNDCQAQFCPAGMACKDGFRMDCPPGFYCQDGVQKPCDAGQFQPYPRMTKYEACMLCIQGHYCPATTDDIPSVYPIPCPANQYYSNTGLATPTGCGHCAWFNAICPRVGTIFPDNRFFCVPGYYCPSFFNPVQFPCPVNTYYDLSDALTADDCLPCPPHFKCPQGSSFLNQNRPYLCPRGSYCDGQSYLCPAGTHNPTTGAHSISYCLPCPPGFICPEGSGSQLQRCPPGYYCPHGASPTTKIPCPPGTFSALEYKDNQYWAETKRGARFLSECFAMHPGTYDLDKECPLNTYNPFFFVPGGKCIISPPGFSTNGNTGAWYPSPCPIGTYSRQNSNCEPCLPHYLCNEIALSEATMLSQKVCPAGYYCEVNRIYECPIGYFCEAGKGKLKCPEGSWSQNVRSSSCLPVYPGYWHDVTNHKIQICPKGYYCLQGQSSGTLHPCPKGTFNSQLGGMAVQYCQVCVAGYQCPNQGMAEPQECSKGKYCPHNSEVGTPCPLGTFNPSLGLRKVEQCQACYTGHYCGSEGIANYPPPCQAGYMCERSEVVPTPDGKTCPDNRYCPGDNVPTNCPPGTWVNGSVDNTLSTHCEACPPGKYCLGAYDPMDCAKGHFCTGGASNPYQNIAQQNQFVPTPGSSESLKCPNDEFMIQPGMDFCFTCTPGFYCSSNNAVICSGYSQNLNNYCVSGNIAACPDGTINTHPFASSSAYCLPCLSGRKCQFTNIKFNDFVTAHNSGQPYELGYYGWGGKPKERVPPGHFTDAPYPAYAFPCPAGTYLSTDGNVGQQSCLPLTTAQFSLGGVVNGIKCLEGYFCESHFSFTDECPPGYKCPFEIKQACHNGRYQPEVGKTYCLDCPLGHFCPPNVPVSQPSLCSPGTYCEMSSNGETPCPVSTYNDKEGMWSLAHCLPCPPGKSCSVQGQMTPDSCPQGHYCPIGVGQPTLTCKAGQYCPHEADSPIPCDPGKMCPSSLMVSADVDCRAGYYCAGSNESGVECPIGAYCPVGSAFPRKCPAGTKNPFPKKFSESSHCMLCDPGMYCDENGLTSNKGFCHPGFYCEAGSPTKYQHQCKAGHRCVNGLSIKCTGGGSYQPRPQASECIPCPKGHTCSDVGKTLCDFSQSTDLNRYCYEGVTHDCPPGQIIYFPGAYDASHCVSCPPGHYCPNRIGKLKVIPCKGGFLCEWQSIQEGAFCPAGYYCKQAERPKECPAGSYCTQGRENPNALCNAGYYCMGKSSTSTEQECPPGSYCPTGTDFPIGCPPGTFSAASLLTRETQCQLCTPAQHCKGRGLTAPQQLCEEGYYCPESSITQYQYVCPRGHYCPAHQYEPKPCSVNNYQSSQGSSSCIVCPQRYQCVSEGLEAPQLCQPGSYCRAASLPLGCPVGSYSPVRGLASSSECMPCPRGYYCSGVGLGKPTGPCYGGYICSGSSKIANPTQISGYECPIGYYCSPGSPKQVPCPPGTYALSGGLSASDQCQQCPPGHYCPKFGMLADEVEDPLQFPCAAGFICTGGAKTPYPILGGGKECSEGKYCEVGATQEKDCPPGKYNPYTGQTECFPCPRGYKCPDAGMSQALNCGAGLVCIAGTAEPQQCPPGTYSLYENLYLDAQCTPCLPGYYCLGGKSIPDGLCQPGYVCYLGSAVPAPDGVFDKVNPTNGLCPSGHYCTAGTKIPTPCPLGKFQDEIGQTSCKPCPEGKYCDSIMLSDVESIKNCADRYYCIEGASVFKPIDNISGRLCEPGYYCKNGLQVPCPPGTYEPRKGSKECQICPAGYYCTEGATQPTVCPELGYCPQGSGQMILCPDGTFNSNTGLQDEKQCVPCQTGHYCQGGKDQGECEKGYFCYTGSASPTPEDPDDDNKNYSNGPCPLGHYCLKGAKYPNVCSDGRIRATVGATQDADCEVCPAGYYCIKGNPVGIRCPKGMYCPTTSPAQPIECPLNTYNEKLQQDEQEDCLTCKNFSTHFCNSRRITKKSAYECPPGHFCIRSEVLTSPQLCFRGTYQANRGASNSCEDCPAGSYCMEGQIVPVLCAPGSICPAKSGDQYHCPPGRYCTEGDSQGKPCPEAFYCPEKTEIPIKCPHGTYCEPGMQQPVRCPPGKVASYNPHNINEDLGCVKCDKGTYTDQFSTNLECQPCEAGYVCLKECKKQFPTIKEQHNGYRCPPGFYCPAGSYEEQPCPKGTYSPHFGSKTSDQCYPCDYNTYSFLVGQNGCRPCGPTATSGLGAFTCTCRGKHRVFHQSSGTCSCETGYQEPRRDVSDDTKYDCVIESRDECPEGQVMDEFSRCSFLQDCKASCGEKGGLRLDSFGLCLCSHVTDVEQTCDQSCISISPKVEIVSSSSVKVLEKNGTITHVDIFKSDTVKGRMACPLGGCFAHSILFDIEGSLSASYYPHDALFERSLTSRSLQTTGSQYSAPLTAVSSPVICIKTRDTLIFQVDLAYSDRSLSNYPIYVRESTLNSDSQFDATPFQTLQDQVLNSNEPITHFVYQFNAAGVFIFASSLQLRRYMVVRVLHEQMCPNEKYYIQPLTAENLFSVGVHRQMHKPVHPAWDKVLSALFFFIIVASLTFWGIAYSHSKFIAAQKEALLQGKKEVMHQRSFCYSLFGRRFCQRNRAQVNPAPEEGKRPVSVTLSQDSFYSSKIFDIKKLISELKGEGIDLTLKDIERIKTTAEKLDTEIDTFFLRKEATYKELLKRSKFLNERFTRISEMNDLMQKEEEENSEDGHHFNLDSQKSDIDEQEMKEFVHNFQKENESADDESRVIQIQPRIESLVESLKTEVSKRTAACEMEVAQRQQRTIERTKKDLDFYLRSSQCVFSEREQRNIRGELEATLAQLKSLIQCEMKEVETYLHSKIYQEQEIGLRVVQNRIDNEMGRKSDLYTQYLRLVQLMRERALAELRDLQKPKSLKEHLFKEVEDQISEQMEKFKKEQLESLQKGMQENKNVEEMLKEFDEQEKEQRQLMDYEEEQKKEYIIENLEELRATKTKERVLKYKMEKAQLKQDKDIRLVQIDKEILYYSEMLTNKYQDSRIESINALAEQERRIVAFELQGQYARELQRLEMEEFAQIAEVNGKLRLLGMPQPVDSMLLKELNDLKLKREKICDDIVQGLDVGQKLGKEYLRLGSQKSSSDQEEKSITLFKTTEEMELEVNELDQEIHKLEKQVNIARAEQFQRCLERKALMAQKLKIRAESTSRKLAKLEHLAVDEIQDRQDVIQAQLEQHLEISENELLDNEDLTYTAQRMIDFKQGAELAHILTVLVNERAQFLKIVLIQLFADKLDELQQLKQEFKPRFQQIEYEAKGFKELSAEEQERKKDIDIKYFELIRKHEERTEQQFTVRHQQRVVQLREEMYNSKNQTLKKYITKRERKLKQMELERREKVKRLIEGFKKKIKRNQKERNLIKKQEEEEVETYLKKALVRQRSLDLDQIHRERRALANWKDQKRRLQEEKREMLRQILHNPTLQEPKRRELIREYRRNLIRTERAVADERTRQAEELAQKLKDRKHIKDEQRMQRDQKLALYRLQQDKILMKQLGEVLLGFEDNFDYMIQRYDENMKMFEKLRFPGRMEIVPPKHRRDPSSPLKARTPMSLFFASSRFNQGHVPSTFSKAIRWLEQEHDRSPERIKSEQEVLVEVNARLDRIQDLLREDDQMHHSGRVKREADKIEEENELISFSSAFDFD